MVEPPHLFSTLPAPQPNSNTNVVAAIQAANAGPKPPVFGKMEALVRQMQEPEDGLPVRCQKLFLTSIPCSFLGYDLVEWLMDRMDMQDQAQDAIHLANLLCQFGYFFPVGEQRTLVVKDDSSLYRFQAPYYWPSQNHVADTTDYAIYLTKRLARNKQKHGLEEYELETYMKLKKGLQHKWEFVQLQAEEQLALQVKAAKDRKKGDKIVVDSQERAYWRVYRPPAGCINCLEVPPSPVKTFMNSKTRKKSFSQLQREVETLAEQLRRSKLKPSAAVETLLTYADVMCDYDPFLVPPNPSNPWVSDEEEFWLLNEDSVELPTERRVRRWAISLVELLSDPLGLQELTNFLSKEFSHENIRFWLAVNLHRYGAVEGVVERVESIYEEFLKPGAPCEINIDGKTMEETQVLRQKPSRYTYDVACDHVFKLLLKKDCYPRFLRSEDYKSLLNTALQPSAKKPGFFANLKAAGPGRKKTSATAPPAPAPLPAAPLRRLGSDEHGGVHVGGPADNEAGDGTAQSSVCPWDTEETCNVCPWDTAETSPKPPPQQPPQLYPRADNILPLPVGASARPTEAAHSLNKSTTTSISATGLEMTPSTIDTKTLDVTSWKSERGAEQSMTHSLGDLFSANTKVGSNTSIPASLGSEEDDTMKFHMDRRPSMNAEKKTVSSALCVGDSSTNTTPSISLTDIHASTSRNPKDIMPRLSSDLSKIKIHIEPSLCNEKAGHRELLSSVSLPFTSIIRNKNSHLDFTVQSGHALEASKSQPLTLQNPQERSQDSQSLQYLSSPEPQGDSAPTTPNVRRIEPQKTLSVSSQTQTDPILQRKTNQQTQHPSRNVSKQSGKTSNRQSKFSSDASADTNTNKQLSLCTFFKTPSFNSEQIQVLKYIKASNTLMTSKNLPEQEDGRVHKKSNEKLQIVLDNEQKKVYMVSRDELEKHHKQQKELARKAQYKKRSKETMAIEIYPNDVKDNHMKAICCREHETKRDFRETQAVPEDQISSRKDKDARHQYDERNSERSELPMEITEVTRETLSPRVLSKSGMITNELRQDLNPLRDSYVHTSDLGEFSRYCGNTSEKTQSLPHNRAHAEPYIRSQTVSSSSLHYSNFKPKQEPLEPVCQKTTLDKSHNIHLSGDLDPVPSSYQRLLPSPETDENTLPVSKSAEAESKLASSPQTLTPHKVWDDPGDICPWEDEDTCVVDTPFVKTYSTLGYL